MFTVRPKRHHCSFKQEKLFFRTALLSVIYEIKQASLHESCIIKLYICQICAKKNKKKTTDIKNMKIAGGLPLDRLIHPKA